MPKYMIQADYTAEGAKGLLREGGTGRRRAVEEAAASMGGTVESMHFAYGEHDTYVVLDFPDHVSMAAVSLTVKASGAVHTRAVALLTPEEIDQAVKKAVEFRPPGA